MEQSGLRNRIYKAATNIDLGRKGFAIIGQERAGRISYEDGIADALNAFKEAQATADPQTIFLAEYYFLSQELHLCDETDKDAFNSLTRAIESFDDAFRVLVVVEDHAGYRKVEKSYPRRSEYRVKGFPKDAYHIACRGHRTRLKNIISSTGIDPIEKALLKQRRLNLTTAQNSYVNKQNIALSAP